MNKLRVLSLFAGIGGFDLGLERTGGFRSVAFAEIDPFCQKVLAKHWPDVPIYNDVRSLPYEVEEIQSADVVTAGFPCQDLSFAGKGAGLAGERSGLWWMVRRTLRMVRPRFALLENVAALLDRGMGTVLGSMAAIGYDAEWHCVQAFDVGEPHKRNRIIITAHPHGLRELQPGWGVENKRRWAVHRVQEKIRAYANYDRSGGDDVTAARMDGCGNCIVATIPEMIGRAILEAENGP